MEEKQRMIQEYVPGKQVTLAHLIANPDEVIFEKLGLQAEIKDAIGILTITPSEAAIIAVDIATKAADVQVGFVDRFSGSLIITGTVSEVEASTSAILDYVGNKLGFTLCPITRT